MIAHALARHASSALAKRYGRRRYRLTFEVWDAEGNRIVHARIGQSPDEAEQEQREQGKPCLATR